MTEPDETRELRPPPRSSLVFVWPESPADNARPVKRDLHWFDVRAGDQLFVGGKRRLVIAVRIYRGEGAANTTQCGRAWVSGSPERHPR